MDVFSYVIVLLVILLMGIFVGGGVVALLALGTSYLTHPPRSQRPIDPATGRPVDNPWDKIENIRRLR